LKCAVLLPDLVYARDPILDVSQCIPVALLQLILLGIKVFLPTG
jgi:hypothetical protein